MPITTTSPFHRFEEQAETIHNQATTHTTFEPRTSLHLDLRIVAFMIFVVVVQILTFKRPFS